MRVRKLVHFLCLLCAAAALHAQEAGSAVSAVFDWKAARVGLSVSRALDQSIPSLQRAQNEAESAIDAGFSALFLEAVSRLVIDSSRTVGSLAGSDPAYFAWIQGLARSARKQTFNLSTDLRTATAGYAIPFFTESGIFSPLIPAEDVRIERRLGYAPTRVFSGLVVYAAEPLPAVGDAVTQNAAPAVFPRLFDEEMNVVFDKTMCRASALKKWGMAGYADSADDAAILARCGKTPLLVVARAVFGANGTDLVIPTRAALQILGLNENIDILKEGKVLIVYPALK
jgi:hypothetical protein